MLIYIPTNSRAAIAVLICAVALCNLNFFQPHKNRILFWLSQISFGTTLAKYTVALLLSASVGSFEQGTIGVLLIVLDVGFIVCSVFSLLASVFVLRTRLKGIQTHIQGQPRGGALKIVPAEQVSDDTRFAQKEALRQTRLRHGAGSSEYKKAVGRYSKPIESKI